MDAVVQSSTETFIDETSRPYQSKKGNRRRARRACLACRARKVRCDVVLRGEPCTNCRLDDGDCIVQARQHKGHSIVAWAKAQKHLHFKEAERRDSNKSVSTSTTPKYEDTSSRLQCLDECQQDKSQVQSQMELEKIAPESTFSSLQELADFNNFFAGVDLTESTLESLFDHSIISPGIDALDLTHPEPQSKRNTEERSGSYQHVLSRSCSPELPESDCRPQMQHRTNKPLVPFSYYSFIAGDILWNLGSEETIFLDQIGCLHLPSKPALDELVNQYFLHVHPTLPLINECDFWTLYNMGHKSRSSSKRLSLFVFQAMLFLACPFVSQSTLTLLGYCSVRQARKALYLKAKHLFHIDGHRDGISSAQGALMLTYHAPTIDDMTNSYWLSTAIHFARSVDAHQYEALGDEAEEKNTLKRLWWCCILRDRVMALSLRRPIQVRPDDFDFDQPGLVEEDLKDEIRGSKVYDSSTKRVVVQLAASLCELAVTLNDVLTVCYPSKPKSTVQSRTAIQDSQELTALVSKLDAWYETAVARFQVPTLVHCTNHSLSLFTHAIYIYYHTAKAYLCNHIMLLFLADPEASETGLYGKWRALDGVDQSLSNITQSLTELEQMGLTRYLPNTFVAFSALPFIWRISDAGFAHSSDSQEKERDLRIYGIVFKRFQKLYDVTDSVLQSIGRPIESS